MKIAIVHDELVRKGGAEQVVLSFHKAFPQAPIYTLSYNPETTYPEFKQCNIITSWFGKFVKTEKNLKRFFFPFAIMAMRDLDLSEYDVVLTSTTHCGKYIKVNPATLVISYCHTPFRLIWRCNSYKEVVRSGIVKKALYNTVISILKYFDKKYAKRTDWFIANAKEVVPRIVAAYEPKNKITVINPPANCSKFYVSKQVGDYYLVVSRFEPYKKVDMVIEAFKKMPDKKLVIVGKGSLESELKRQAVNCTNITFKQSLTASQLADLYSKCKAFIFPQLEDYGITPLEANASGRPVIAYGKGGVLETMLPAEPTNAGNATALFFHEQSEEALIEAIQKFDTLNFDPYFTRLHAEEFDESRFIKKIQDFVSSKVSKLNVTINGAKIVRKVEKTVQQ